MEGPAGLVAKQLQQHVLTFLQGCKEIPRSLCAPPDAPDLPPKHSPPPPPHTYLLVLGAEFVGQPLLKAVGDVLAGGWQALAQQTPPLGAVGSSKGIGLRDQVSPSQLVPCGVGRAPPVPRTGARRSSGVWDQGDGQPQGSGTGDPTRFWISRAIPTRIRAKQPRIMGWGPQRRGEYQLPRDQRGPNWSEINAQRSRSPRDLSCCVGPQLD